VVVVAALNTCLCWYISKTDQRHRAMLDLPHIRQARSARGQGFGAFGSCSGMARERCSVLDQGCKEPRCRSATL
jgi:hypothetical protein